MPSLDTIVRVIHENNDFKDKKEKIEKSFKNIKEKSEYKKLTKNEKKEIDNIYNKRLKILEEIFLIHQEIINNNTSEKTNEVKNNNLDKIIETEKLLKKDSLEKQLLELDEQEYILSKKFTHLGLKEKKEIKKLDKEQLNKMPNISSQEFLKLPLNDRLKYITYKHIDSSEIIDGTVSDIEINFIFNNKFNRELYLKTTAGMVLPLEVRNIVVNGVEYSRNKNSLKGEFFSNFGKRLIIKDSTKIDITTILSKDELENKKNKLEKKQNELEKKYKGNFELLIGKEAIERGYSYELGIKLFSKNVKEYFKGKQDLNEKETKAYIEELFVNIDRYKGHFYKEKQEKATDDGKLTISFTAYLLKQLGIEKYDDIIKELGFKKEDFKIEYDKQEGLKYNGNINIDNINLSELNITKAEVERIRKIKKFRPGSKDTIILFKIACKIAKIDESWANNSNLHYIMKRESAGIVGRLNYTIKGITISNFKEKALNYSNKKNPIGSISTASGLGQLLLSNVDRLYPSGRKGLGDPIEEAIGFIKYIRERYGNPDITRSVYGIKGSYINSRTGKKQYKSFKEGY